MGSKLSAVIFDMVGVLMDTVPFWAEAERAVFGELGVIVSDELAALTSSMSTTEVTDFWYRRSPWSKPDRAIVEQRVIERVELLIRKHGRVMPGVRAFIAQCRRSGCRLGLGTNSPRTLMHTILDCLGMRDLFDVTVSADDVSSGKPHPEIYLKCLMGLTCSPESTLVVEDSLSGAQAGMAARCHVALLQDQALSDTNGFIVVPNFESLTVYLSRHCFM